MSGRPKRALELPVGSDKRYFFFSLGAIAPQWALAFLIHEVCFFLGHTQHTTVGRTPLDER